MTRFSTMCAVLALSVAGPMFAQDTSSPPNQPMNPPTTQPSTQAPAQSQPMSSPAQSTAADLTGQSIYSAKGTKLGTVASMSTDAQTAAVTMGKHLGMGGQTVLIPISSLQARSSGGYTTTLSATELKALPKAGGAQ